MLRYGERSFAHLTGQRPFEIFASAEREFFLELVDASLSFDVDPSGRAVACTIHQNAADRRAPRLE